AIHLRRRRPRRADVGRGYGLPALLGYAPEHQRRLQLRAVLSLGRGLPFIHINGPAGIVCGSGYDLVPGLGTRLCPQEWWVGKEGRKYRCSHQDELQVLSHIRVRACRRKQNLPSRLPTRNLTETSNQSRKIIRWIPGWGNLPERHRTIGVIKLSS